MTQKRFFALLGKMKGKAKLSPNDEIRFNGHCPITIVHANLAKQVKELNIDEYDADEYEIAIEQLGLDGDFAGSITYASDYDDADTRPLRRKLFKTLGMKWKE